MGETIMGLSGKKYLSLSNGAKNATPIPPFVIASSTACDDVAIKRYNHIYSGFISFVFLKNKTETAKDSNAAKKNECVMPRWPQTDSYGMPAQNPIASRSGMAEHTMPVIAILAVSFAG